MALRMKKIMNQIRIDASRSEFDTHLEISSSVILSLLKRIVQFWARRPSMTDRILERTFPIIRKSSMDPSFCERESISLWVANPTEGNSYRNAILLVR